MGLVKTLRDRVSLRMERRKLQVRAFLKGRELRTVADRTATMPPGPVVVSVMRNESPRLDWFLHHYRQMGVVHFLMVDNGSTDSTVDRLANQSDVSLWHTDQSYRLSRFGMDWVNHLLTCHADGRWVLVVDPDELLIYPHHETRRLPALIRWLESRGRDTMGTLLLDLYGRDSVAQTRVADGGDPVGAAGWFDANNYFYERHNYYHNIWIQGGPRLRMHFAATPGYAPALNKTPLVRWRRGYAYRDSTHNLLPRRLNRTFARDGAALTTGVLLHTKFVSSLAGKVAEEMVRGEHYAKSAEYRAYAARGSDLCLWTPQSTRFEDWRQLCALGLMDQGAWL